MNSQDDEQPDNTGVPTAPVALVRPRRGRLRMVAGVTGLAALLGSGAYLTTTWVTGGKGAETREVTAIGAVVPQNPSGGEPAASGSAGASTEKSGENRTARVEPSYETPAERVRKAREAAAKEGVKITRPLPVKEDPAGTAAAAAAKEVTVGSAREGGTMRIVTVRGDLTGQRELAWVAGDVKQHGKTSCSQRFKLFNEQQPKIRPNMLVCWRTSEKRSVVVVDTKIGGRPPVDKSLAIIDREWSKLG